MEKSADGGVVEDEHYVDCDVVKGGCVVHAGLRCMAELNADLLG
jgi:hypothetical protein